METNQDGSEVLETTEEIVEGQETQEETTTEIPPTDEEKEQLRKENEELKKKNAQLFERAKKAKESPKEEQFSAKDTLALVEAKVSSDDFDEVVRVSKILGKPIAEALKDKTMQSILKERVEERATARATQTGGGRRAPASPSPEALIEKAARGEASEADIDKLVEAEMQQKIKAR